MLTFRDFWVKKDNSHLGLSAAEVRDAIKDSEYMETIANLMRTTRSPTELKKWIETHQYSEKNLAELAERFRVSEAAMSKLIE